MIAGRNATPEMREAICASSWAWISRCSVQYALYLGKLVAGRHGPIAGAEGRCRRCSSPPACRRRCCSWPRAIFAYLLFGLPAGIYAAMRRGTVPDKAAMIALLRRRLGAAIRRRPAAALSLRLQAGLAAAWAAMAVGQLILPALTLGGRRRRLVFAHDALLHGRSAAPGLHADGAGQGPAALARRRSCTACAMPCCRSSR